MPSDYQLLRNALLNRTSCVALYDGYLRHFCPHVIGRKDGVEQALCWQFAGESSRPLPPQGQWKCFTISKLSQLSTTSEPLRNGEAGHTGKPTTCVGVVDEEVLL